MASNQLTRRRFIQGFAGDMAVFCAGCTDDEDDDHDHDDEYEVDLIDRETNEVVADYHGHWHGEFLRSHSKSTFL